MAPLNIVVVGAGISGLTAGILLRREGHSVTVLEKSTFSQEAGAAIHLGSNVSGLLQDIGFDFKGIGAVVCAGLLNFDSATGAQKSRVPLNVIGKDWKNPYYMVLRTDLHAELRRLLLDEDDTGPVPDLQLGARVSQLDVESGVVILEDGRTFTGDVIVGADGNHSVTRKYIQSDAEIEPWGKGFYRWLIPRAGLLADEEVRYLFEDDSYFGEMTGNDRRIVWYPCKSNTLINFAAAVPAEETNADGDDFQQQGNKERMLKAFENFCRPGQRLLQHAEGLKVWDLYTMDVMLSWYKGKLVIMGDAAHPFLPFLAQGGAMAIEDAVSLAALLPEGTKPTEVEQRFKLYQKCRHERATAVQIASRMNGFDLDKRDPNFNFGAAFAKAGMHNEWEISKSVLADALGVSSTS